MPSRADCDREACRFSRERRAESHRQLPRPRQVLIRWPTYIPSRLPRRPGCTPPRPLPPRSPRSPDRSWRSTCSAPLVSPQRQPRVLVPARAASRSTPGRETAATPAVCVQQRTAATILSTPGFPSTPASGTSSAPPNRLDDVRHRPPGGIGTRPSPLRRRREDFQFHEPVRQTAKIAAQRRDRRRPSCRSPPASHRREDRAQLRERVLRLRRLHCQRSRNGENLSSSTSVTLSRRASPDERSPEASCRSSRAPPWRTYRRSSPVTSDPAPQSPAPASAPCRPTPSPTRTATARARRGKRAGGRDEPHLLGVARGGAASIDATQRRTHRSRRVLRPPASGAPRPSPGEAEKTMTVAIDDCRTRVRDLLCDFCELFVSHGLRAKVDEGNLPLISETGCGKQQERTRRSPTTSLCAQQRNTDRNSHRRRGPSRPPTTTQPPSTPPPTSTTRTWRSSPSFHAFDTVSDAFRILSTARDRGGESGAPTCSAWPIETP